MNTTTELTCWNCSAVVSPDDPICLECGQECRFACDVCGKLHTPNEPSYAAWSETPEEPSMCSICPDCEDTLPQHPEEGWPLTPLNIFA